MKNNLLLIFFLGINSLISCKSQSTFGERYLKLDKSISLPNVGGRIDHMDINLEQKLLYVAALGNNTLEVVDLKAGKVIHSITGLHEPQGVGYIPQTHEIFIANGGNGDCYFYNTSTYVKTAMIHLSSDADDVRYDSATYTVYVGYGEGGIAIIDARTHTKTAEIQLPAHPEGFQLDRQTNRILVNIPDRNMIAILDLERKKMVSSWKRDSPTGNFPMALDLQNNTAFIGYRHPAELLLLDIATGREINSYRIVGDVDDLFYDNSDKRIYVSGGGGYVNVFRSDSMNSFSLIMNMATQSGARTSLLIPTLQLFVLAERSANGNGAQLLIYHTQK
jgi:DNA-binding beta-propeller fold protein YncE